MLGVVLGFAVLASASPARAQETAAQASARGLFDEGVALMGQSRYAEACPKLEQSLAQFAGLGTRGKLAECYEKAGRFASAWAAYKEVAQLAASAGDTTREKVANERATALEPKLAYLTLVPPSSDVPGLVVKRNGVTMALDKPEPVDAGLVQIEATAPGRRPFTTQIMATSGQTSRLALPNLDPLGPAPTTALPRPRTEPPAAPRPTRTEATPWQVPVGLATGGAGLLTLAVGGIVGLSAKSTYDDAFTRGACDATTRTCDGAGQNDTESARRTASTATILVGAGAALTAIGAVLWLTAPSGPKSTALHVAPSVGTASGGLVLGGRL